MLVEIVFPGSVSKQLPLSKVTYKSLNKYVRLNTEYIEECAKIDAKYAESIPEGSLVKDVFLKPEYHKKCEDVALRTARFEFRKAAVTLNLSSLTPEEKELFLDSEGEFWDDQDLEAIRAANESFRQAAKV